MIYIGIDPGTRSFDICGFEDNINKLVIDDTIPTEEIAKNPEVLIEKLKSINEDFVIAGPSGYGLSILEVNKLTNDDIALTTLDRVDDIEIPVLIAVRKIIKRFMELNFKVYMIPSIILLPTVPIYRKFNKIDMGTADKVCIAILGIWDQVNEYKIDYGDVNFILIELGFAYNACIVVENGKIIDGVGGTLFPGPSYLAHSWLDGEIAYLNQPFSKLSLFKGGVTWIAIGKVIEPEEFIKMIDVDEKFYNAWKAFLEGILRVIGMELTIMENKPREVIISGRLSRVKRIYEEISELIERKLNIKVRKLKGFAKIAKEAAQGAAIIANGLSGGIYKKLIEHTQINKASGTVLDYVTFFEKSKEEILKKLRSA